MAGTANGKNIVIHLKARVIGTDKIKRTTASIDTTLADLVCLKMDNILAKDGNKTLTAWAQQVCDEYNLSTTGISERIRFYALMLVAAPSLKQKWMDADG